MPQACTLAVSFLSAVTSRRRSSAAPIDVAIAPRERIDRFAHEQSTQAVEREALPHLGGEAQAQPLGMPKERAVVADGHERGGDGGGHGVAWLENQSVRGSSATRGR